MNKLILLAVIILGATVSAAYTLIMLDQIVNGQLYNYGLWFSSEWANPYWNLLRITMVLLCMIAISTIVSTIFTYRKLVHAKTPTRKMPPRQTPLIIAPTTKHTVEKPLTRVAPLATSTPPPSPSSLFGAPPETSFETPPETSDLPETRQLHDTSQGSTTPAVASETSDISSLVKCFHCGKMFSQPLRMLDFQGDRSRIVDICPFCNEIIPSTTYQENDEEEKKFQFRKKNNNQASRTSALRPSS